MKGRLVGNYSIVKEIDSGNMGTVYLAEHISLKNGNGVPLKAAIKILHPHLTRSDKLRERFIQEAQTQFNLHHEGITRVIDYSEDQNGMYIVMEYLQGITLDRYISEVRGLIPEAEAMEMFTRILDAVEYAHQRNIVHRDLKPSNIMVLNDQKIKIMDFGIARIIDGDVSMTRIGTRLGSPMYMSPEQAQAREVDFRSDIYTLGVVLFEMITGTPVYDKNHFKEDRIYHKIIHEPLPRVKDYYELITDHIQQVIDKATAKNPDKRFQDIASFRNALLKHEKIIPKPVNPLPLWVILGAAVLSVVLYLFLMKLNRPGNPEARIAESAIQSQVKPLPEQQSVASRGGESSGNPQTGKPDLESPVLPTVTAPSNNDSQVNNSDHMGTLTYVDQFNQGSVFSDVAESHGTYQNHTGFSRITSLSARNWFISEFTFDRNAGNNFTIETEIRFNPGTPALNNGSSATGIIPGTSDLMFMLWQTGQMALVRFDRRIRIFEKPDHHDPVLSGLETGRTYRFRFTYAGDILSVFIDGRKYLSATVDQPPGSTFGFVVQQGASADILSFTIQ